MKSKKNIDSDNIWAVRGVSPEARNAAKMAAKKSNVSLGSWLSRKIIEAAQDDLTENNKQLARQEDMLDILQSLSNKFEKDVSELRTELEQMRIQKRSWLEVIFNRASKS